jgi:hypothetical protein
MGLTIENNNEKKGQRLLFIVDEDVILGLKPRNFDSFTS